LARSQHFAVECDALARGVGRPLRIEFDPALHADAAVGDPARGLRA
jgi:hypothetical protein